MKVKGSLVFVGAVVISLAPLAWALPSQDATYYYYSDSTFQTQVGSKVALACTGGHGSLSGRSTRYVVIEHEPCSAPSPIEIECRINGRETYCPVNVCDAFDADVCN